MSKSINFLSEIYNENMPTLKYCQKLRRTQSMRLVTKLWEWLIILAAYEKSSMDMLTVGRIISYPVCMWLHFWDLISQCSGTAPMFICTFMCLHWWASCFPVCIETDAWICMYDNCTAGAFALPLFFECLLDLFQGVIRASRTVAANGILLLLQL